MKKNGFITIIVIFFMSVILISVFVLTQIIILWSKTSNLDFDAGKAKYLAESGISIAKKNFNKLSIINDLDDLKFEEMKNKIYNNLKLGTSFSEKLDGIIYIFKDSKYIYSVGITKNNARRLIQFDFNY